jgi:hypothetical protein
LIFKEQKDIRSVHSFSIANGHFGRYLCGLYEYGDVKILTFSAGGCWLFFVHPKNISKIQTTIRKTW